MKVRSLLLSALAASMTFVSCSQDEDAVVVKDTTMKTVSVSLANVLPVTRAIQDQVEKGTTAKVTDFQIFFVDAEGKFYNGYAANDAAKENGALNTYFNSADDINAVKTYHYIDANVTKVVVVANLGKEYDTTGKTASDLLEQQSKDIADQQDVDKLILVGESGLTLKETNHNTDPNAHVTDVYEAKVEISPLIARFEISSFRYNPTEKEVTDEDGTTTKVNTWNYSKLTLNNLAINKYAGISTYVPAVSGGTHDPITDATVWTYVGKSGWFNHAFGDNVVLQGVADENAYSVPSRTDAETSTGVQQTIAFNVFPETGVIPQFILTLTGTKTGEDGKEVTQNLYLATKNINGITGQLQRGYVYRMVIGKDSAGTDDKDEDSPFEFEDKDFNSPDKCIEVTVSVMKWQVVYVTPEF